MVSRAADKISCHGIPQIASAKSKKAKTFWVLVLLLFSVALATTISEVIGKFLDNATLTSTTISNPMKQMEMPKILICQTRQLSVEFLKKRNMSDSLLKYILRLMENIEKQIVTDEIDREYNTLLENFHDRDVRQFFFAAGPNCSSFLTNCFHNKEQFNCCQKVETKFDPKRGKCFLFGSSLPQKVRNQGLRVTIQLRLEDYMPRLNNDSIGLILKIYPRYNPFQQHEIQLLPGYHYEVHLEKSVRILENSARNTQCNESMPNNTGHSVCQALYLMEVSLTECNCSSALDASAFQGRRHRICSPVEWRDCLYSKIASNEVSIILCSIAVTILIMCVHRRTTVYPFQHAAPWCMSSCTKESYAERYSHSRLAEPLGNGVERVQLHITFRHFRQTTLKQIPAMQPETLVTSIGGAMGVFLGASLISCIELLAVLSEKVRHAWAKATGRVDTMRVTSNPVQISNVGSSMLNDGSAFCETSHI